MIDNHNCEFYQFSNVMFYFIYLFLGRHASWAMKKMRRPFTHHLLLCPLTTSATVLDRVSIDIGLTCMAQRATEYLDFYPIIMAISWEYNISFMEREHGLVKNTIVFWTTFKYMYLVFNTNQLDFLQDSIWKLYILVCCLSESSLITNV